MNDIKSILSIIMGAGIGAIIGIIIEKLQLNLEPTIAGALTGGIILTLFILAGK
jgi:hypothetical protein